MYLSEIGKYIISFFSCPHVHTSWVVVLCETGYNPCAGIAGCLPGCGTTPAFV